jgi:hypothetical protein
MLHLKHFTLATAGVMLSLAACHSDKANNNNAMLNTNTDTTTTTRKVSVVISSIPFPSGILDTLHSVNSKFDADLTNPVSNMNMYTESNAQAANLGVYGADLAYVISFEQFQPVGLYMKTTKFLADNIGIPLAFSQEVIERCEKNQNNKDSLKHIVFQSYNVIDQTLKQSDRSASEVLVLLGGWIEGAYLTTQSLASVSQGEDKKKVYGALFGQKPYVDKLVVLLNDVSSSPYCQQLVAPMLEIKKTFSSIMSADSFDDQTLSLISDKVKALRTIIVKGNS